MAGLLSRTRDMYLNRGPLGTAFGIAKFLTPHPYDAWVEIARVERKKALSVPLSLPTRLALYRRGFESHTYHLYGFENGADPDAYLSEFVRKGYTGQINGEMSPVLNDKRKFHAFMSERGLGEYLPDLFGVIEGDGFISETYHSLSDVFDEHAKIVIKDTGGSAGDGVYICEREDEFLLVNGERWTRDELTAELHGPTDYLVTEFCEQAPYLEDIYPHATNTLRVLMMNPDNEEPFIAIAVQRLGTRHSGSLDNFSQGGLSVEVDTDTGECSVIAQDSWTTVGDHLFSAFPRTANPRNIYRLAI